MTERHSYPIKPFLQLIYLLLVFFACAMLGILLTMLIISGLYGGDTMMQIATASASSPPDVINALKIFLSFGNTICAFLAPAIFFGYLIVHDPEDYLKMNRNFNWLLIPLVLVIMVAFNPVMELMVNINSKLILPDFLKGVEEWMREKENESQQMVAAILNMNSVGEFISSLIIIGLLPAIAEEFLFRGCLQTIFKRWTGNTHLAIWITAIIFSTIHLQFFGFLPRMLLGALFGYMVAWSGSIWPAVWAHFINNGTAVVVTYLYQRKAIKVNPDDTHIFNYVAYIISLIIVLFLLRIYKNIALSKKQLPEY
jgi:membrane protease YdiL (CAAX protease family)